MSETFHQWAAWFFFHPVTLHPASIFGLVTFTAWINRRNRGGDQ